MIPLERMMTRRVVTITEDKTVRDAARTMHRHVIGAVVVKRKQRVVGILTERDILGLVAKGRNLQRIKIKDVMSAPVIVGAPDTHLEDAIKVMVVHNIKKLPVLRGTRLVGMVTLTDFARFGPVFHDAIQKALEEARAPPKQKERFRRLAPEPPVGMYA